MLAEKRTGIIELLYEESHIRNFELKMVRQIEQLVHTERVA